METDRSTQTDRFSAIITQTVLKGELSDFCLEQEANFNPVSKALNVVFFKLKELSTLCKPVEDVD